MKKLSSISIFFIIFCLLSSCVNQHLSNKKELRILFIGNSLTAENNLPQTLAFIAKSHGNKVIYDSYTIGGSKLFQHAANIKVINKIKQTPWDYVVLQEHGKYTALSQQKMRQVVFPHAKSLADIARNAHHKTDIIFYMTMARRSGNPENKHISPDLLTYTGTQSRVNQSYLQLAKTNHALIAPVGEVWRTIRQQRPDLHLYGDEIHPNKTGTYIAACVFYASLFNQPCSEASFPNQIPAHTSRYIQSTVNQIVLKNKMQWDYRQ